MGGSIIDNGQKYVDPLKGNCISSFGTWSLTGYFYDKITVEIVVLDANGNEQSVAGYPNPITANRNMNNWSVLPFTNLPGGKTYKVKARLYGKTMGGSGMNVATNIATYQL